MQISIWSLDKVRINVPTLASISIVTQGEWIQHKDQLKSAEQPNTENTETDEQAIERIAGRFAILDEMAEAASQQKVRAMIVSGPPGIGKSYGVERALEKRSMFDDIAGSKRKFEVVKGAMSAVGLFKKLYEFGLAHRLGEQVALQHVAVFNAQFLGLFAGFNTFGNHLQVE